MSDIRLTEDSFIKKPPTNLSKDTQEHEFVKSVDIRLKIAPAGAYRVLDDFNENEVIKNEDGYFIVSTSLPGGEWLLNYILSFGPVAEVLEPKNMREIIQKNLEEMIEQYKK